MEQANPGDVVALASGGPDLAVLKIRSEPAEALYTPATQIADVGWFTAVGEYRTGSIPLSALALRRAVDADGWTSMRRPDPTRIPGPGVRRG